MGLRDLGFGRDSIQYRVGKTHCQGHQDPSKRVPIFLGTPETNVKMVPINSVPIPRSRTVIDNLIYYIVYMESECWCVHVGIPVPWPLLTSLVSPSLPLSLSPSLPLPLSLSSSRPLSLSGSLSVLSPRSQALLSSLRALSLSLSLSAAEPGPEPDSEHGSFKKLKTF